MDSTLPVYGAVRHRVAVPDNSEVWDGGWMFNSS